MKRVLWLLVASSLLWSAVDVDINSAPWVGLEFGNETGTVTYTNNVSRQMQIDGIRIVVPNCDLSTISGEGTFAEGFTSTDSTFDMLVGDGNGGTVNDNLPNNVKNPGKGHTFTMSTTTVEEAANWTPYFPQVLIIGSNEIAGKKVNKDITGITLEELDSIMQLPHFYDSTLYVLDTLGIHGSEWGAGFIDTWVDQETNEPIWQIQVCDIPFVDTNSVPGDTFRFWNEYKAFYPDSLDVDDFNYGATKRPFYMMGLAMTQEYMNIDMQSLMAKGFQESNAGLSMGYMKENPGYEDTLWDTIQVAVDAVQEWSWSVAPTLKVGDIVSFHGDYYKAKVNSPTINVDPISWNWDTQWESTTHSPNGDFKDSIVIDTVYWKSSTFEVAYDFVKYTNRTANGATSMGPMHYEESTYKGQIFEPYPKFFPHEGGTYQNSTKFIDAPSGGSPLNHPSIVNAYLISSLNMWYSWQLVVAALGEDALDQMKNTPNRRLMSDLVSYAWNQGVNGNYRQAFENGGINFIYIDQINNGIEHLEKANRNSVLNGGDRNVYDAPIDLATFEEFFFGDGGSGSAGSFGSSGLLHHFDLDVEDRKELWNAVESAFNMLKGKAPSTTGTDYVSYRYDYLAILRIAKSFLDLSIPVPKTEIFKNWTKDPVIYDHIAPVLDQKSKEPGFVSGKTFHKVFKVSDSAEIADSAGMGYVEWTMNSDWKGWRRTTEIAANEYDIAEDKEYINSTLPTGEDSAVAWVKVTDKNGNSVIDTFLVWRNEDDVETVAPALDSAGAYDSDGDGSADRIKLYFTTTDNSDNLSTIFDVTATWPNSSSYSMSSAVSGETVILTSGSLSGGNGTGTVNFSFPAESNLSGEIADRVGPAIMTAQYLKKSGDTEKDTLAITLSEDIDTLNSNNLLVYRVVGSKKVITAEEISFSGSSAQLIFAAGSFSQGDSISLNEAGSIVDIVGNSAHASSSVVEISFDTEKTPTFVSAGMFDTDGNSTPDSIEWIISLGDDKEAYVSSAISDISFQWPKGSFETTGSVTSESDTKLTINGFSLTQPFGTGFISGTLPDNSQISGNILDHVGPVIVSAERLMLSSAAEKDTIRITLSESLDQSELDGGNPSFRFHNGTSRTVTPESATLSGTELVLLFPNGTVTVGDSISIDPTTNIIDDYGNHAAENNQKIALDVKEIKSVAIKSAKIYSGNGDGKADSLVIDLSLASSANRFVASDLGISFEWVTGTPISTFDATVLNDSTIVITEFSSDITAGTGLVTATQPDNSVVSSEILDFVGPVIFSAERVLLSDLSEKDTVRLTVSEALDQSVLDGGNPSFRFHNGATRIVSAESATLSGTELIVIFPNGTVSVGDSISIDPSTNIIDANGNHAADNNQRIEIDVKELKTVSITSADMYSRNGNGTADSLLIKLSLAPAVGRFVASDLEISFEWLAGTTIGSFETTIQDDSTIIITGFSSDITSGLGLVTLKHPDDVTVSKEIHDRIGAVITTAQLIEKRYEDDNDSLIVSFSESVNIDNTSSAAALLKNGVAYSTKLTVHPLGDSTVLFIFSAGTYRVGDSVSIHSVGSLKDIENNSAHIDNPSVEITLIQRPIYTSEDGALFLDRDADGVVDFIEISFERALNEGRLKGLEISFDWPGRTTERVTTTLTGDAFAIADFDSTKVLVELADTSEYLQGWTSIDEVSMTLVQLDPVSLADDSSTVTVTDGMAPVIINAEYFGMDIPDEESEIIDTMVITFSEEVTSTSSDLSSLFLLKDRNDDIYSLSIVEGDLGKTVRFLVSIDGNSHTPKQGDSIWIKIEGSVEDSNNNTQSNSRNKGTIFKTVAYRTNYDLFVYPNPYVVGDESENELLATYGGSTFITEGVIGFMVRARGNRPAAELTGTLTVKDPLGNNILFNAKLVYSYENDMLLYAMQPTNESGRTLGSGMYKAYLQVENAEGVKEIIARTVGIKE